MAYFPFITEIQSGDWNIAKGFLAEGLDQLVAQLTVELSSLSNTVANLPTSTGNGTTSNAAYALLANNASFAYGKPESQLNVNSAVYLGAVAANGYATLSGNTSFDSGTLFIDAENNRIGIGTTTPETRLEVKGNDYYQAVTHTQTGAGQVSYILNRTGSMPATWELYIPPGNTELRFYAAGDRATLTTGGALTLAGALTAYGSVGIGVSSSSLPSSNKVQIQGGDVAVHASSNQANLFVGDRDGTNGKRVRLYYNFTTDLGGLNSYDDSSSAYKQLNIDGLPLVLNSGSTGNVGIGLTAPSYKLHVNGAVGVSGSLTLPTPGDIYFGTGNSTTSLIRGGTGSTSGLISFLSGTAAQYADIQARGGTFANSISVNNQIYASDNIILDGNNYIYTTANFLVVEGKTNLYLRSGSNNTILIGDSTYSNVAIAGGGGQVHLAGGGGLVGVGTTSPNTTLTVNGSVYVTSDVSALTFTDRTPHYDGDALADLAPVKGTANREGKAEIDHSTLPAFARRTFVTRIIDEDGRETDTAEEGRDLGAMISILTKAIQQIAARLDAIEQKTYLALETPKETPHE